MSQTSEERATTDAAPTARILPFERPQSDIQRAIQERAQENIELQQARRRFKPTPMRWVVIFMAAVIPVGLMLGAMDGILRAMQMLNAMYEKEDAERARQAPPPVQVEEPQQPGIVLLKPFSDTPGKGADTKPPAG